MANHASSKKRVKRNAARAVINTNRRSRMRTFIRLLKPVIKKMHKLHWLLHSLKSTVAFQKVFCIRTPQPVKCLVSLRELKL